LAIQNINIDTVELGLFPRQWFWTVS